MSEKIEIRTSAQIIKKGRELWVKYLSNRTRENRKAVEKFDNQRWIPEEDTLEQGDENE